MAAINNCSSAASLFHSNEELRNRVRGQSVRSVRQCSDRSDTGFSVAAASASSNDGDVRGRRSGDHQVNNTNLEGRKHQGEKSQLQQERGDRPVGGLC